MKRFAVSAMALAVVLIADTTLAKEITIGVPSHRKVFDPSVDASNAGGQFSYSIFDTLIERDAFAAGKFVPGLATEWKMIEPTVMELKLREGVTFHNGDTMDAEDVAASLNPIFQQTWPRTGVVFGRFYYNFKEVEIVDPMTVRIHTHQPDPLIETLLSARNGAIKSKTRIDEVGLDDYGILPVGAGPYRVVSFEPDQELVVERFEDYWGEPAPLDKITFLRIPEVANRITALVSGEIDMASELPPDQMPLVDREDGLKRVDVTWDMFHVLVLNQGHEVMKDQKLRQALKLAVDLDTITEGLWKGRGISGSAGHQFPAYGDMYTEGLEVSPYDVDKARALLAESNYNGETIEMPVFPYYYLYGPLAAQAIAEMWQEIGVNAELKSIAPGSLTVDVDSEIAVRQWSNPMYYNDIMGGMDTSWSDTSWVTQRGFFDPTVDPRWKDLYQSARFSLDQDERKAAYQELMAVGEEMAGWILLYQPADSYAMKDCIEYQVPSALRPLMLALRAGQINVDACE
ncbi:ABC transporter substrate-binding protein [Bauldia sp.]|uniref:ABC transporter substrate-binding protein n=1 Tax=Bauldia sp. TaxID=2575872 RepID=UPI003BAB857A